MAPNITECERTTSAEDAPAQEGEPKNATNLLRHRSAEEKVVRKKKGFLQFETEVIWTNVVFFVIIHAITIYYTLTFDYLRDWRTSFYIYVMHIASGFGVTAGAHRYWTHKAFKAKLPMKLILLAAYASAGENKLYDWVRDHRVHHRYTDTPADPHNNKRGVFFSHVGWLMMRKNPEVIKKGREVDMSDISSDPILVYFDKHFQFFKILFAFVIPTIIPVVAWNETWERAFISQCIIRYVITLNCTWSVNSLAHTFGFKPFNRYIRPADNVIVAFLAGGEGWHNYHHVFPWDYNTSEHGFINITKYLIDMFGLIGWVYDRKTAPRSLVKAIKMKAESRGDHPEEIPYESVEKNQTKGTTHA